MYFRMMLFKLNYFALNFDNSLRAAILLKITIMTYASYPQNNNNYLS